MTYVNEKEIQASRPESLDDSGMYIVISVSYQGSSLSPETAGLAMNAQSRAMLMAKLNRDNAIATLPAAPVALLVSLSV